MCAESDLPRKISFQTKHNLDLPDRKRVWTFLREILREDVEPEIRHGVRLGRAGETEACRLARLGQTGKHESEGISHSHSDGLVTVLDRADLESAHRDPTPSEPLLPFTDGQIEFFPDQVLLCGAVICHNGRPKRMRDVLNALRQTGMDGGFISYSGPALAETPSVHIVRVVRNVREHICEVLRRHGVECGKLDVILSRGCGYRFSQKLTVHEIREKGASTQSRRSGRVNGQVSGRVTGRVSGTVSKRRMKILENLADGRQLRLPSIASQLSCSERTARRDLDALRAAGVIEFVGPPRTGYYRLLGEVDRAG
jgi:biotin operon repressor